VPEKSRNPVLALEVILTMTAIAICIAVVVLSQSSISPGGDSDPTSLFEKENQLLKSFLPLSPFFTAKKCRKKGPKSLNLVQ